MGFGRRGVSAPGTWRVSNPWLQLFVVGTAGFVAASLVVSSFPSTPHVRHHAPSVLTELRRWVAAHTGAKHLQLSSSTQSAPAVSAALSLSPTTTTSTPAPAAPTAGTPRTAAVTGDRPSGCGAALAYLAAHAAPGFVVSCPHPDGGYQATTTCVDAPQCEAGTAFIWIEDPCPAAYMNEASNSWVLIGASDAPIDPYGYCGEPGNPYG